MTLYCPSKKILCIILSLRNLRLTTLLYVLGMRLYDILTLKLDTISLKSTPESTMLRCSHMAITTKPYSTFQLKISFL